MGEIRLEVRKSGGESRKEGGRAPKTRERSLDYVLKAWGHI
jgi:hypothetical protein